MPHWMAACLATELSSHWWKLRHCTGLRRSDFCDMVSLHCTWQLRGYSVLSVLYRKSLPAISSAFKCVSPFVDSPVSCPAIMQRIQREHVVILPRWGKPVQQVQVTDSLNWSKFCLLIHSQQAT